MGLAVKVRESLLPFNGTIVGFFILMERMTRFTNLSSSFCGSYKKEYFIPFNTGFERNIYLAFGKCAFFLAVIEQINIRCSFINTASCDELHALYRFVLT